MRAGLAINLCTIRQHVGNMVVRLTSRPGVSAAGAEVTGACCDDSAALSDVDAVAMVLE